METSSSGPLTATRGNAAPIHIHPDGRVTLDVTSRALRFLADAATSAVNREADGLLRATDTQTFFANVAEEVSIEDECDIAFDAAILVGALAILARARLAMFLQSGLSFVHHGAGPLLDELADLGVVPFDQGATATSVVETLVTDDRAVIA